MQITCYSNFSKKPNSTKQPTGSGTLFTCTLKEPTSIIHPVFILVTSNAAFNYIKWGSRYYFVDDIILTHNNYTEYHCSIDALASWKTEIGASSEYVTRSASSYDGDIIDMMYPAKASVTRDTTRLTSLHSSFVTGSVGFYVVGVIGSVASGSNAIQYFALSNSDFRNLINYLFSNTSSSLDQGGIDISVDTQKQLLNPAQYIASCHWYPMPFPDAGMGSTQTINFGWWASNVSGMLLSDRECIYSESNLSLPNHPDISRGSYLNGPAYTNRTLHIYNFGSFPLPCDALVSSPSISVEIVVDLFAGTGILRVFAGNYIQVSAEVGCEVPLAQISLGILGSMAKGAADSANWMQSVIGTKFESAVAGAYSAIASAIAMKSAKVNVLGGQGSNAVYAYTPLVESNFYRPVNDDVTHNGKPLCQVKTLNTLSGYIKCENAEIDIPGTQAERDTINSYMNDGFYYE